MSSTYFPPRVTTKASTMYSNQQSLRLQQDQPRTTTTTSSAPTYDASVSSLLSNNIKNN
ncbi:hypothetical protein NC653_024685 [Populus alba x Populus x berolinensis]|uniref:Uncharacterized protein n=1 Tax=Populus alba x Populus x berolinensis TaxID=444605 RepID=A0AAD6Q6U1_9ROSI|nr:hypothetical protein NC653_024685 [Populus alba x Populus x berolinensis]